MSVFDIVTRFALGLVSLAGILALSYAFFVLYENYYISRILVVAILIILACFSLFNIGNMLMRFV